MQALGMIETRGLLASIVAADTMLKTAQVTLLTKQKVGGGLVTVIVTGDVASTQVAVEAAKVAVAPFDCLVSAHVIARPIDELEILTESFKQQHRITEVSPVVNQQSERVNAPKAETGSQQMETDEHSLWDRAYLESLKVVELRSLVREQKKPNISGAQIRNGKKEELIAFLLKAEE